MERVETKNLDFMGKQMMVTKDEQWVRMLDLIKILNNNLIYTIAKMLEEGVGARDITRVYTTWENNKEYKFVNVENVKSTWEKNRDKLFKIYPNAKSVEASVKKLNFDNQATKIEGDNMQKSIDLIFEELIKISKMEASSGLKDENKKLLKEKEFLADQLSKLNAKYDELKSINLKIVSERDSLMKDREELQHIRNTMSSLFKTK
ncbi:MAG: hypothetical protein ACRC7S_09840 [Cetobacterium sp.]